MFLIYLLPLFGRLIGARIDARAIFDRRCCTLRQWHIFIFAFFCRTLTIANLNHNHTRKCMHAHTHTEPFSGRRGVKISQTLSLFLKGFSLASFWFSISFFFLIVGSSSKICTLFFIQLLHFFKVSSKCRFFCFGKSLLFCVCYCLLPGDIFTELCTSLAVYN